MTARSKAPAKDHYHHGDLHHALLEAALELVTRKGIEGFSLREAARAVGVSAAAVYRHFEDRSALLAALALDAHGRMALEMEEAIARAHGSRGTPERAIAEFLALGATYVEFAVANPSRFRVMFGPWCKHPEMWYQRSEAFPRGRDTYQILIDTLDGLVRSGVITPAARQRAEISAWTLVHGLAAQLVQGSLHFTAAGRTQAYRVILRTLLLGLGASPSLLGPATASPRVDPRVPKVRQKANLAKRRS